MLCKKYYKIITLPVIFYIITLQNHHNHNKFRPASMKFDPTPPILGSWRRAELFATNIIETLDHWVTGYVDWNLGLDTAGGPNMYNFTCDASIVINETANEAYKEPFFYAMGHFSKFFQPGAVVLNITKVGNEYKIRQKEEKTKIITPPPTMPFVPTFIVASTIETVAVKNNDGSYAVHIFNPCETAAEIIILDQKRGYAFILLEANSINTVLYW